MADHSRDRVDDAVLFERMMAKSTWEAAPGHVPPELGPCLIWHGSTTQFGYGEIRLTKARCGRVHRMAWVIRHGDPPAETPHVLHRCDVRRCWASAHLWLGTNAENTADRDAKGRHANSQKTHCPANHPYSGSNLKVVNGKRECRACKTEWFRRKRSISLAAALGAAGVGERES